MTRISIDIDSSDPAFAAVLSALAGSSTAAQPVDDKPKATPRKAAEPAKNPAAKTDEPKADEPAAPTEDKLALLKSLAMKYSQKNTREALVALFAEYGATNPSTVPADQIDTVIARLQE